MQKKFFSIFMLLNFVFAAVLVISPPAIAYTTNMSADVVIGQQNFTSSTSNQGGASTRSARTMQSPNDAFVYEGKLFVADRGNNRVLIFNQIPTTNNAAADVVVGQANFTAGTSNQGGSRGANTLALPASPIVAEGKLIISDINNSRVLIFNSIPTSNNASADVVIGQSNFSNGSVNQGGSAAANTIGSSQRVAYDDGKLIVSDNYNNRILIYNHIPTSNNASADVVVGQQNFFGVSSNQGGSAGANTVGSSAFATVIQKKLVISDAGNNRVLIFNRVPTTNNASADVVVGQRNFSSSSVNQGGTASATTLSTPFGAGTDGQRLFIADDANHRVLIYNQIPTTNNASADVVIGQSNFSSTSANQGGNAAANTYNFPTHPYGYQNYLIVPDFSNNRVLIYNNITRGLGITLNKEPVSGTDGKLRMNGIATTQSPYTVNRVEFNVNGSGFSRAIATDGAFDSTKEDFYFEFDPLSNRSKDKNGNWVDGYSLEVQSMNSNGDDMEHAFYFAPFNLNSPADKLFTDDNYPTFDFSVHKDRGRLRDHLTKYQVLVNRKNSIGDDSWQVLVDNIPVDFRKAKANSENLQKAIYEPLDTDNGVYETNEFTATYADDSSTIRVKSKVNKMDGATAWKIVAVDPAGNVQETGAREIFNTSNAIPLSVLNISGLGNPQLNSFSPQFAKKAYSTSSSNPTFFGVAPVGAQVSVSFLDPSCIKSQATDSCTQSYSATANPESRYGINVPKGKLISGKKYVTTISATSADKFAFLPQFELTIGGNTSTAVSSAPALTADQEKQKQFLQYLFDKAKSFMSR